MKHFKFELTKLIKSKTLIIVLILSIVFSGLSYAYNKINRSRLMEDLINQYMLIYSGNMDDVKMYYESLKGEKPKNPYDVPLVRPLKILHDEMNTLFEMAFEDSRRHEIPSQVLKVFKALENRQKAVIPMSVPTPPILVKASIEINKTLMEKGLPYENPDLSLTGANFSRITLNRVMGFPLTVLILLLSLNIFGEEHDSGTERLRFTQPRNRYMYYLSKIMIAFLLAIIFILGVFLTSYIIGGLFGTGFGTFDYPMLVRGGAGMLDGTDYIYKDLPISVMNLNDIMIREVFIYLCYLILVLSLIQLISVIVKGRRSILGLSLALLFGVYLINSGLAVKLNNFSIFTYFPLLSERSSEVVPFLNLNRTLFFGASFVFAPIIVYIAYHLSRLKKIQEFGFGSKFEPFKKTIEKWENRKFKAFPQLRFELLKFHRNKEVYVGILLLFFVFLGFYQIRWSDYDKIYAKNLAIAKRDIKSEDHAYSTIARKILEVNENYNKKDMNRIMYLKVLLDQNSMYGFRGIGIEPFVESTARVNSEQYDQALHQDNEPEIASASGSLQMTYFDEFKDFEYILSWSRMSKRAHKSVYMIGNYFYKEGGAIFLLVLTVLFLTQGFSGETERNTLGLHKIQPGKRAWIYFSKLAAIVVVLVYITFSWVTWLPISTILRNNTDIDYPIPHYSIKTESNEGTKYPKTELVNRFRKKMINPNMDEKTPVTVSYNPVWKSNLMVFLGLIAMGLFIISLGIVSSLFIKGRWSNATVVLAILGLGFWISHISHIKLLGYLPFAWLNPYEMSSGYVSLHYDNPMFTPLFGILVLILWGLLVSAFGITLFKKVKIEK